ncbi:MAG: FtsX-like permease family protein [Bacteroidaceae bacterium]|nr:FtsX-like permease family protein [Bacteroidaceae bacterium]
MKDFLKNLFATRGAAFWLNLLGLSLAFVVFYILMAEVMWVHHFDRCYKDSERIYQVCRKLDRNNELQNLLSARYSLATAEEIAAHSPAIEYAVFFNPYTSKQDWLDAEHPEKTPISIEQTCISPDFAHVFGLDIIEGNATLEMGTDHALIPLSFAKKLFGEQGGYVGRVMVTIWGSSLTVWGVYNDLPSNASIENIVYVAMPLKLYNREKEQRTSLHYMLFVRLHKGASPKGIFDNLEMATDWTSDTGEGSSSMMQIAKLGNPEAARSLEAVSLRDIRFMLSVGDFGGKCNIYTYYLYICLAVLIVFIASINYMNFAMAMIPYRIKEINIRKIFGERSRSLRLKMAGETCLLGVLAFALSLFILWVVVQNGFMDEYVQCDLALTKNFPVLGALSLVALGLPLVASLYPTWYTTSRKPAMVVNGSFALSPNGRALRHMLIGVQFSISLLVIILLLLMNAQHYYIRHVPVGYARDSILYVHNMDRFSIGKNRTFKQRMKEHPAVVEYSGCGSPIGTSDNASMKGDVINGQPFSYRFYYVGSDYMKVMGIPIIEGRDFREEDGDNVYIFTESARVSVGLAETEEEPLEVVGIIPDIQTCTFRAKVAPTAFVVSSRGKDECSYSVLRIDSPDNIPEVKEFIRNLAIETFGTDDGLNMFTPDETFDDTYKQEKTQIGLVFFGSVISLAISLIGVFGLVLFETRARRKEIGIRKVFGATTRGILVMFNMQYLRILGICFIVASPIAYDLYLKWIENFAFRTPMHWWLFGVAFLIVALVVCLTVTIQSWRAARERPVDTIMK